MNAIEIIEKQNLKSEVSDFKVGDLVKVAIRVVEGQKTRTENFEGTVIRRRGKSVDATFTVLKQTRGSQDTVEKTFPLHSPNVQKITVIKSKPARRAKLYYMRNKRR